MGPCEFLDGPGFQYFEFNTGSSARYPRESATLSILDIYKRILLFL